MVKPTLHESVYILRGGIVAGDVVMGEKCSVWFNATVRGDRGKVTIGPRTNVQDGVVIHSETGYPVNIGEGVVIGHNAVVHGCTVGDNVLIGMGAVVLNGAVIGKDSVVGAGAVVPPNMVIPDGMLAVGCPAKVVRAVKPAEVQDNKENADNYYALGQQYRSEHYGYIEG